MRGALCSVAAVLLATLPLLSFCAVRGWPETETMPVRAPRLDSPQLYRPACNDKSMSDDLLVRLLAYEIKSVLLGADENLGSAVHTTNVTCQPAPARRSGGGPSPAHCHDGGERVQRAVCHPLATGSNLLMHLCGDDRALPGVGARALCAWRPVSKWSAVRHPRNLVEAQLVPGGDRRCRKHGHYCRPVRRLTPTLYVENHWRRGVDCKYSLRHEDLTIGYTCFRDPR